MFEVMKREDALVWQTHPRTKGSTGYPDKVKDADYLRSDRWLGTAFKAMPVDLSQRRLGEVRCFGTLDDMNNWGGPKYMVGGLSHGACSFADSCFLNSSGVSLRNSQKLNAGTFRPRRPYGV